MGQDLAQSYPMARELFERADEILGFKLSRLTWQGSEHELNKTQNTQPALLVHSIAAHLVFQQQFPEFQPACVAGHSMGEISALVVCGALNFEEALHLIKYRGELMKQAGEERSGGMAAILGMTAEQTAEICQQSSAESHCVQIANDNCPGQIVISGDDYALERAMAKARLKGAKKVQRLAVSIASHSPLMQAAQVEFKKKTAESAMQDPVVPIIGNVTAQALFTALDVKADLSAQLTSPVRWRESLLEMKRLGVTTYLEVGSGSVLLGLVKRT